jgi:hypothetical protein
MTWRDDNLQAPMRDGAPRVGDQANQVGGACPASDLAGRDARGSRGASERARNLQSRTLERMARVDSRPASPTAGDGAQRRPARIARWFAAGLVVLGLWACGPVYIPVPPPSQITFTAELVTDSSGATRTEWITAGGPEAKASNGKYYVFDLDQNVGVIAGARDDGSFQAPPLQGQEGDRVLVYYDDALGRPSASSCKLLSEQRPVAATCP